MKNNFIKRAFTLWILPLLLDIKERATQTDTFSLMSRVVMEGAMAMTDKDPNNGKQIKTIMRKYRPEFLEVFFGEWADEIEDFIKERELSEAEATELRAQIEVAKVYRKELLASKNEKPNFDKAIELAEKSTEYPTLAALAQSDPFDVSKKS
ncbi:hypothetical protein [Bernardetia sp.]|uniref:hypothetical protein n=1 Tax=Bernardetia sp. TaxID=1937974 RepID=UPI0025C6FB6E|nr:hypothetical protein [Bernardetia sp.]